MPCSTSGLPLLMIPRCLWKYAPGSERVSSGMTTMAMGEGLVLDIIAVPTLK